MAHVQHFNIKSMKNIIDEQLRELDFYKNDVDPLRLQYDTEVMGNASSEEVMNKIFDRVYSIMGDRPVQAQTNLMSSWKMSYPKEHCDLKRQLDENGKQVFKKRPVYGKDGKPLLDDDGNAVMKNEPMLYWWPKDMDHYNEWVQQCIAFNAERYGKDNIISCSSHLSEYCPHITVLIVPEAQKSRKSKIEGDTRHTVSTASLFTRKELKTYHDDLQKYMNQVFQGDRAVNMHNGETLGITELEDYKIAMDVICDVTEAAEAQIEEEIKNRTEILEKANKVEAKKLSDKDKALENKRKSLETREKAVEIKEKEVETAKIGVNVMGRSLQAGLTDINNIVETLIAKIDLEDVALQTLGIWDEKRKKQQEAKRNEIRLVTDKRREYLEKYSDIVGKANEIIVKQGKIEVDTTHGLNL